MPAIGEVSVAWDSDCCAAASALRAAVTAWLSAFTCASDAPALRSADSLDSLVATVASACATEAASAAESIVASTCPVMTCWPTVTETPVTRPETPKVRLAWWAA
ncbi:MULTISPECIES: hypothetical protein [Protofrankia]|uniref:Uncharacterized protein n=1 Tax=Candidatus Protofrankia datiscae TaxID=2716812 RepID=F8AXU9_9ACTN|nr:MULTISPECIES: hypothetical protein [Protofrankia]AEH11517.1 hypothetical protein FsymDg_4256 [Candidatus Protofrankia datiscae]